LFDFYHEEAGAGLVFYHPDGAMLRKILTNYIEDQNIKRGYELLVTPHMLKGKLWEMSGHADHYKENMYFFDVDEEHFAVKPMNCPGHILVYKSKKRSYRELPVKYFELGTVYRKEKAGVLHGLLRVRGFTQDDAHIFCREDQIKTEIIKVIDFVFDILKDFGFNDVHIELSTRPEKYIGKLSDWEIATNALEDALKDKKLIYQINEGDGAFYGPKIDIKLCDALKREWQCATIQCDFALPERFDMTYVSEDGSEKRPIMIHRAILGSVERFFGTLIEHYGGAFPVWLAPKQVCIIPIKEEHNDHADKIKEDLQIEGIRVIIDKRNESLSKRIRENTVKKIPYIFVIGDKELAEKIIAVRRYGSEELSSSTISEFINKIKGEILKKQ
jgi:threonyl-tRNA synthetase